MARAAILALMMGLFARTFLVETYEIESASMASTLLPGDHVLVNRMIFAGDGGVLFPWRAPRRGDVVAIEGPSGEVLVKRIVALPGEVVELASGELRIDGVPWRQGEGELAGRVRPIRLRSKELYLLGDDPARSRDSRHWGPADVRRLRGRAQMVYWSSARPEGKMEADAWQRMRSTRWRRLGRPIR